MGTPSLLGMHDAVQLMHWLCMSQQLGIAGQFSIKQCMQGTSHEGFPALPGQVMLMIS